MNLVGTTSSQMLYGVVNSAYVSERHTDEMHRYFKPESSEPLVGFSDTLKALTSALLPIAASGD